MNTSDQGNSPDPTFARAFWQTLADEPELGETGADARLWGPAAQTVSAPPAITDVRRHYDLVHVDDFEVRGREAKITVWTIQAASTD